MRNRGYLQFEKRTKSGKKRFFIKKQNKVSNLEDQFEEVVFLHQMKEEEEIGEESQSSFHDRRGKITSFTLIT